MPDKYKLGLTNVKYFIMIRGTLPLDFPAQKYITHLSMP